MWSEEEKWIERKRGIWAEKVLIIRIFSIRMLNIRRVIRKISKMKNLIKITEIWARMHNGKISLNLFLEYLLVKGGRLCHSKIWLWEFRTHHLKIYYFVILIILTCRQLKKSKNRDFLWIPYMPEDKSNKRNSIVINCSLEVSSTRRDQFLL